MKRSEIRQYIEAFQDWGNPDTYKGNITNTGIYSGDTEEENAGETKDSSEWNDAEQEVKRKNRNIPPPAPGQYDDGTAPGRNH